MALLSSECLYHNEVEHDILPSSELAVRLQYNMTEKYPAKTHARRVAEALGVHHGLIALSGSPNVLWANSDQGPPFRQERYFYYLTGCNEPGCYVTYDIRKDKLTLWLAPIDEKRVVWTGRGSTVEEALEKYDIDDAKYLNNPKLSVGLDKSDVVECELLERFLADYMEHGNRAWRVWTILSNVQDSKVKAVLEMAKPSRRYDLRAAMDNCRVIKDDYEIMLIRKASEITAKGHKAVLSRISRLENEAEVEAEYMRVCIANHAREQAYAPIAGSGPNAAELHYGKNNEDFGERQMMVMDAGCEYECYASDVTRTIPLNKQKPGHWPSKEAEDVYKIVERIQEACIAEMKPGNSFAKISLMSFEMTLDGLMELGILKGHREDIRRLGTQFAFFPHGLGHHMGLEVHDVGARPPPQKKSRAERSAATKDVNTRSRTPEAAKDESGSESPDEIARGRTHFPTHTITSHKRSRLSPQRALVKHAATKYVRRREADGSLWLDLIFDRCGAIEHHSIRVGPLCSVVESSELAHVQRYCIRAPVDHPVNRMVYNLAKQNPHISWDQPLLCHAFNCQMDAYRPDPIYSIADFGPDFPHLPTNFDFRASMPLDTSRSHTVGKSGKYDPTVLKPGMVITIEPGIYFNRFLIERFFLSDPAQKQYIDQEVLDRYWNVGGVRIEDDILITKDGHENLTTAPKGQEMLDFIRKAAAASTER